MDALLPDSNVRLAICYDLKHFMYEISANMNMI